jgi:SAM-dependent methyltransferase
MTEYEPRYVLGADPSEVERLQFQQEVWGPLSDRFLDRLSLRAGSTCLDGGCGPGFVLASLSARVGPRGHVIGLDQSAVMIEHARQLIETRKLDNVSLVQCALEEFSPQGPRFDLIWLRWVLSFPAEPERIVHRLASHLRPGGWLAIQDYNHHGLSLFPDSPGFRAVIEATRALYRQGGGDAFIAGRLPGILRRSGLELVELTPNVLAGGPQSAVFRWGGLFFPAFSAKMVEAGLLSAADRAAFLREWEERKNDTDALFFSPILCDMAARRPA